MMGKGSSNRNLGGGRHVWKPEKGPWAGRGPLLSYETPKGSSTYAAESKGGKLAGGATGGKSADSTPKED